VKIAVRIRGLGLRYVRLLLAGSDTVVCAVSSAFWLMLCCGTDSALSIKSSAAGEQGGRRASGHGMSSTLVETVSINYEDFSDSFLTCGTCLCVYDGVERAPKLLACSHTVCQSCLEHIIDAQVRGAAGGGGGGGAAVVGSFRCPICRETITVPRGGVAAFPPSFIVNQVGLFAQAPKILLNVSFVKSGYYYQFSVLSNWRRFLAELRPVLVRYLWNRPHAVVSSFTYLTNPYSGGY